MTSLGDGAQLLYHQINLFRRETSDKWVASALHSGSIPLCRADFASIARDHVSGVLVEHQLTDSQSDPLLHGQGHFHLSLWSMEICIFSSGECWRVVTIVEVISSGEYYGRQSCVFSPRCTRMTKASYWTTFQNCSRRHRRTWYLIPTRDLKVALRVLQPNLIRGSLSVCDHRPVRLLWKSPSSTQICTKQLLPLPFAACFKWPHSIE